MSTNASKLSLLAPNVNTSGTVEATTLDGLDSSQFLRSDIAVTKTGNLTVNGNVYSNAFNSYALTTFHNSGVTTGAGTAAGFTATTNVDGGTTLDSQYHYVYRLTTTGTGTDTGATYIVWYNEPSATWLSRQVSANALDSNHPLLSVSGSTVTLYTNHTGAYGIFYTVERRYIYENDSTPHAIGEFYNWQRVGNTLSYIDGNIGINDSSPDYKLTVNAGSLTDSVFGIRYNDTARIEMAVDGNWNYYKALSGQSVKFTTTGYTGTASLSVLNNGYVGIGHDNPSSRLSVYDMGGADGTASRTAFFGNLTTGATSSSLYIGSYSGIDWQIGKNVIGSSARWNFDIADHQNNIALTITPSREVLIGTGTADQGIPGLTIGRAVAGDNNDYGVSIIRHGTGASPGTFTVNRGAINVSDTAGEGPASYIQNGSLINAGYGRMLTSDPNTHLGALIDISYDGGLSPLRLDLKGNMWLGHNRATAETSASTTHALFAAGPIWSRTGLVNVKNSIMPGAGSTLTYGADDCLPGLAQSFGTFLTTGASAQTGNSTPGADGHIWSATWTNTTVYGCQLYIDTDPTNYIAVRTRTGTGTWQSWRVL